MTEKHIKIEDFDYRLETDKIAENPLLERNRSRLLVYDNKTDNITDRNFYEIAEILPANSLMVVNDSKVIHARLLFINDTGAKIEIFCMEPIEPTKEMAGALNIKKRCVWKCMIGNLKKWKEEEIFLISDELKLKAKIFKREESEIAVEFFWESDHTFGEILSIAGNVPLPPYIKRKPVKQDNESYQTVYANIEGSVAAPTAGLHFTKTELKKISENGIKISSLNLNVGAGTFLPIKTENADEHKMHPEKFYIGQKLIEELINNSGKVISTGTTSLRALESLYWIGCKMIVNNDLSINNLGQWEHEKLSANNITYKEALGQILKSIEKGSDDLIEFSTSIMIVPGYEFKAVNILITNFHQPKSTLLLLVSAFTQGQWRKIYEHALKNEYRFLSYGDSSVLFL